MILLRHVFLKEPRQLCLTVLVAVLIKVMGKKSSDVWGNLFSGPLDSVLLQTSCSIFLDMLLECIYTLDTTSADVPMQERSL